jgi:hypothetical protein
VGRGTGRNWGFDGGEESLIVLTVLSATVLTLDEEGLSVVCVWCVCGVCVVCVWCVCGVCVVCGCGCEFGTALLLSGYSGVSQVLEK